MPIQIVNTGTPSITIASGKALSPSEIPALVSLAHVQSAASDEWTINHNLNFVPNVTVIDSGGNMVEAQVVHQDNANLTINFSSAISGTAYLS
jgi:hypothetical protein